MKRHLLCVTLLATLAAATPLFAGDLAEVQKTKAYAQPTDDAAVVYIVRPGMMGKMVKTWAFVDDTPIGVNKGKQYTFAMVSPGQHLFWSNAENTSAVELDVEAGKTYYLKQGVKMGMLKARVKLTVLDEAGGKKAIEKCKYTTLTDAGRERASEIVAQRYEKVVGKLDKVAVNR